MTVFGCHRMSAGSNSYIKCSGGVYPRLRNPVASFQAGINPATTFSRLVFDRIVFRSANRSPLAVGKLDQTIRQHVQHQCFPI